jgi:hypothetical protein
LRAADGRGDVALDALSQRFVPWRVQQLKPVNNGVVVLDLRNGWAPLLPACCALAGIEWGAEESNDNGFLSYI